MYIYIYIYCTVYLCTKYIYICEIQTLPVIAGEIPNVWYVPISTWLHKKRPAAQQRGHVPFLLKGPACSASKWASKGQDLQMFAVSIHLCICPSIHLSIYPSIHLSMDLSIYLSTYLSIYLSIFLFLSACLSVYLSFFLPVCLPVCLSVCLSASIYLSNLVHLILTYLILSNLIQILLNLT